MRGVIDDARDVAGRPQSHGRSLAILCSHGARERLGPVSARALRQQSQLCRRALNYCVRHCLMASQPGLRISRSAQSWLRSHSVRGMHCLAVAGTVCACPSAYDAQATDPKGQNYTVIVN